MERTQSASDGRSTYQPFAYRALEDGTTIRLIKVRRNRRDRLLDIEMLHVDLPRFPESPEEIPVYRCLSYTWGQPPEAYKILVNGKALYVRKNLYEFLELAARLYPDEPLWIDALCISQNNIPEKNHQVQRMGFIYAKAAEVLLWLGNRLNDPWEGGQSLGFTISMSSRKRQQQMYARQMYVKDMQEICSHEYWDRAWIAQEVLVQSNVTILSGREIIDLEDFAHAILGRARHEPPDWVKSPVFALIQARTERSLVAYRKTGFSFWYLLKKRSASRCVDIRDRIYSLLALTHLDLTHETREPLQVDYGEDVTSLFWRVGQYYDAWVDVGRMAILMRALELSTLKLNQALESTPNQTISMPIDKVMMIPWMKSSLEPYVSELKQRSPDQIVNLPLTYMVDYMRSTSVDAYKGLLMAKIDIMDPTYI